MRLIQKLILALLPLLTALSVIAQTDTTLMNLSTDTVRFANIAKYDTTDADYDRTYAYFITSPIEFPIVDYKDVNKELVAAGYPKCKAPFATWGFGWNVQLSHFIGILSYNRNTGRSGEDTFSLKVAYRAISIGIGYDVLNHPYYSFFPFVGFKFCKTIYRFDERLPTAPTMGNYLQTNLDHKEISNSMSTIDLGIGGSYQSNFLIGLRGGVLLPLGKPVWNINGNSMELGNSPGLRYQGYVTLTIGVGTSSSERKDREAAMERQARGIRRMD